MASGLIVYLDTSAFLKLYLAEPGSDAIGQLVADANLLCTHMLGYAEMRAALSRAARLQHITPEQLQEWVAEFEHDWETLRVIAPDHAMIRRAGGLAEQCQLKGYDSIHLAAAEAVALTVGMDRFTMAVYDKQLAKATRSLGIPVFDIH